MISRYCSKEWVRFVEFYSEKIIISEGDFIFQKGEKTNGVFIVLSGHVKICTSAGNNKDRLIRLAKANDILGHRGFGGNWKYTVSGIALSETEVQFIPLEIFEALVKGNPEFAYYMMTFIAEELRDSESFAELIPIRNVIAKVLVKNLEAFGFENENSTRMSYTLTRSDLASLAGTRYETLIRTLAEFNTEGIIRIEGKSLHILKQDLLRKIAKGEE